MHANLDVNKQSYSKWRLKKVEWKILISVGKKHELQILIKKTKVSGCDQSFKCKWLVIAHLHMHNCSPFMPRDPKRPPLTRSNERLEAQECVIMARHETFMEEYGTPAPAKWL